MPNGSVKFFNVTKGFGFITSDDGGKELFVPAASLVSAGIAALKAGQRVSFETKPDSKGPKAVNITLLANPPPPVAAEKTLDLAPVVEDKTITFYHNPADEGSRKALDKLRATGCEPRVVEYLITPPSREELKNLSVLLRGSDQSLVRKYDPLFLELCLDDRFISETEFWGAIFEHPSLINGPIVATRSKARLCRSGNDVEAFLAANSSNGIAPVQKRKTLPEGILRLLTGGKGLPPAAKEKAVETVEDKPAAGTGGATVVMEVAAVKPVKSVKPAKAPEPAKAVDVMDVAAVKPVKSVKPAKAPESVLKTAAKTQNKPKAKAEPKPKPKAAAKSKSAPPKKPATAASKKAAPKKPAAKTRRA